MVLKKLGPAKDDVDLPYDAVKKALDHMVESSINYVEKEHLLVLWDSLQVLNYKKCAEKYNAKQKDPCHVRIHG